MPLDPRLRRFLDLLAAAAPRAEEQRSIEFRRKSMAELMKFGGAGPDVARVEDATLRGPGGLIPARIYTPLNASTKEIPGLVYFHGGGLVAGDLDTHDPIARSLADAGRCRVIAVGYRLAPEHRFPAAIEDAIAAIRHVRSHADDYGIDPWRLGIAGDSAGATLAAVACQATRADPGPPLAMQLLLCPITDYGGSTPSRREFSTGYLIGEDILANDLDHYLAPGISAMDWRVSPVRAAEFSGLPPTLIHTAEFDPLRDEGRAYAERLRASGVPVVLTCHSGMVHLFYGLGTILTQVRTVFDQIGVELRHCFAATQAPMPRPGVS